MAIDDQTKRRAATQFGQVFHGLWPVADTSISRVDRRQVVWLYPNEYPATFGGETFTATGRAYSPMTFTGKSYTDKSGTGRATSPHTATGRHWNGR
jgi:hypothetical protein